MKVTGYLAYGRGLQNYLLKVRRDRSLSSDSLCPSFPPRYPCVGRHINLHRTCTFIVLQLFGGLKASCHYCNRRHILVSI